MTTPQPTSAAFHNGIPAGSGTADPTGTTQDSAKHDTKLKWRSRSPSTVRSRVVPSDIVPFHAAAPAGSHRFRLPARHWRTRAARGHEAERDAVAGRVTHDVRTDRLDHAGTLVTQDDRHAFGPEVALRQVEVGVAHARGGDAHAHLPRLREDRGARPRPTSARPCDAGRRPARGSGRSCRPGALERVEIERHAQARALGRTDRAVGRDGSGRGNIQSRRSGPQAGGSNGTSMNGTVDTAIARWRFAIKPIPFVHVWGLNARPAASATSAIRRQPPIPPASITSGCTTSTPPRRIRSRASWSVRTISPAATRRDVRPRSTA